MNKNLECELDVSAALKSDNLLRHAALSYSNQWNAIDGPLRIHIEAAKGANELGQRLSALAGTYQVARNFVSAKLTEEERRESWARVAEEVIRFVRTEEADILAVTNLAGTLGRIFPLADRATASSPNLLSAATKFLWFGGRTTVRIYDKRAVDALNKLRQRSAKKTRTRVNGDYAKYASAWESEFELVEAEIVKALERLPEALTWSTVPPDKHDEVFAAKEELWFKERVFDKYLWTIGSGEHKSSWRGA